MTELTTRGRRRRAPSGEELPSSKDKFLDAAEQLFAAHGYDGASLRDIAALAQAPFGLASYYFGTKEELFRQVVGRRAGEHVGDINASLDQVVAEASGGVPRIDALVRAYFAPIAEKVAHRGPGWRNYMQLLARAVNLRQEEEFLQNFHAFFDPVRVRFVEIAAMIFPHAERQRILWGSYFLNAAMVQFISGESFIDRISGGECRAADLDAILRNMVPYFAGGFRALVDAETLPE